MSLFEEGRAKRRELINIKPETTMSEKRFCPECNAPLEGNEMFCENCGTALQKTNDNSINEENGGFIATNKETAESDGISRSNIMGSVNKSTTNNTSNSVTTNNVDNSSSTVTNTSSSIDNSTVNNTTIVMSGKNEAEFCEVCGNPFEGKHARCPKCGKSVCFDCKVKGKNRCVECEKKAQNEYRMAFQELLMTTNGQIGVAGRQMMNRKARELDIEDACKKIEEELLEVYKPQTKAQQPTIVATTATVAATSNKVEEESKGVGAITGGIRVNPLNSSSKNDATQKSNKMWVFIAGGVVAILLAYILLGNNDENKETVKTETVKAETVKETTPAKTGATVAPANAPTQTAPAQETVVVNEPEPVVEKADAKYDAGMKAYESGDGLKALENFKASGSAKSYYMIGVIYENGCGSVAKNAMMARKNFKKAAQMGSSEAQAKL